MSGTSIERWAASIIPTEAAAGRAGARAYSFGWGGF